MQSTGMYFLVILSSLLLFGFGSDKKNKKKPKTICTHTKWTNALGDIAVASHASRNLWVLSPPESRPAKNVSIESTRIQTCFYETFCLIVSTANSNKTKYSKRHSIIAMLAGSSQQTATWYIKTKKVNMLKFGNKSNGTNQKRWKKHERS